MASDEVPQMIRLPDPPTDGITGLQFLGGGAHPGHNATLLLASTSWDGSLRIHDIGAGGGDSSNFGNDAKLQVSHSHNVGPLLSLACSAREQDDAAASSGNPAARTTTMTSTLYTGGLDGSVQAFDVTSNTVTLVGKHKPPVVGNPTSPSAAACSCVALLPPQVVITAGWDRRLYVWDVRQDSHTSSATTSAKAPCTVDLPGKAFCMDVDPLHSRVAVGCSGRQTCLIDLRRPTSSTAVEAELSLQGESSQKHQTRCLRFFPDGQRIAVGSVEGRVAVEWVDGRPLESNHTVMPKEYAFKCHRRNDLVFPVNCIEFHPVFGTFATGGGDGTVVTWDGFNRKRLTALPAFGTSVAALAFSPDGRTLAMASSYTFEEGERDHPRDEIFVRRMLDTDCQPKSSLGAKH